MRGETDISKGSERERRTSEQRAGPSFRHTAGYREPDLNTRVDCEVIIYQTSTIVAQMLFPLVSN